MDGIKFKLQRLNYKSLLYNMVIILGLTALALGLRFWPLQKLGFHIPYLTFYPAVMLASLLGGIYSGILMTGVSALVVCVWQSLEAPFLQSTANQLGMFVFVANGIILSCISESLIWMHSRARIAIQSERMKQSLNALNAKYRDRLFETELKFKTLFDLSPSGMVLVNPKNGRIMEANKQILSMFDYSHEQLHKKNMLDLACLEDRENMQQWYKKIISGEMNNSSVDRRFRKKDGTCLWVRVRIAVIDLSHAKVVLGIVTDINKNKQNEQKLLENEALFREVSFMAQVGGWEFNPENGIGRWTEEVAHIHDVPLSYFTSAKFGISFFHGENREKIEAAVQEAIEQGKPYDLELELISARGVKKWVRTICHPIIENGKVTKIRGAIQDITKQKRLQERLEKRDKRYRAVIETTTEGFLLSDEKGNFLDVNNAYCELSGYSREELLKMNVSDVEVYDSKNEIIERIKKVHSRGAERFITYHRRKDGSTWPIEISLNNLKQDCLTFAFISDITERVKNEKAIKNYITQLETSVEGTFAAISTMVEKRDPYTAGHEKRVGIIASDIAREMGWPEDKCNLLRLIGLVHDVGKIAVPAEILTKPGRLTPLERDIARTHVDVGYDILKDVVFPIPIAEIVHQHHERMDGSGYPKGLHGEQILMEARILAVADVLESMSSHRPYRPALGLDRALDELTSHKGILYDAEVVDALECLIHKKYQLPE